MDSSNQIFLHLLGELYEENDSSRDSAFTIFYMGINVGAFLAPLVCGFLSENLFKTTVDGVMLLDSVTVS